MIPGPLVAVVLVLAAYRFARLIGWDDFPIATRVREWAAGVKRGTRGSVNDRMGVTGDRVEQTEIVTRPVLEKFIECPFCSGFWIGAVLYGTWVAVGSPGAAGPESWLFYVLVPFALNGAVGLVAKNLDP